MKLAIDIGNSRIKTALFSGDKFISRETFSSVDELIQYCNNTKYEDAALSSVVPFKTALINEYFSSINKSVFILSHKSTLNFSLSYKSPSTLGTDRICSAACAVELAKKHENQIEECEIISVDFGTATTVNIVKPPLNFTGGMIAPGVMMMFGSLNTNTSQLPEITTDDYRGHSGSDTSSSIAAGVINSVIGGVTRCINPEEDKKMIFITGGNYHTVKSFLAFKHFYEEDLVLKGLNHLALINQ